MMKKLTTVPFDIDPDAIAEGMLDMFDEQERTVLRFGMLPAKKMELLENMLREKFTSYASYIGDPASDEWVAITAKTGWKEPIHFSMKRLVNEAVHEVTLALYQIGDLVV